MPKHRVDPAEALRDVKAAWTSRGYRAEYLAARQYDRDIDPHGELAYQRAFAEAAKKDPPRLPNPSHYPHSESATAFLQKRNKEFFNPRAPAETPNPKYESPIPDMYWRSKEEGGGDVKHSPNGGHMAQLPHAYIPPPLSHHTPSTISNGHHHATPPSTGRNPPLLMEPKMGAPMGPPSRFR